MKNSLRKFKRSLKAVSPVIATLLMIVIAVAASLVAYAWVMGYLGFTTAKVGKAIQIQSVVKDYPAAGRVTVYAQNVGDSDVVLANIYVDGDLDDTAGFTVPDAVVETPVDNDDPDVGTWGTTVLHTHDTATITLTGSGFGDYDQLTVKLVNVDGSFIEYTKTFVE